MLLLAIETSCDETAVSVLDVEHYLNSTGSAEDSLRADIVSSQIKLHAPFGGVVPELAAREHLVNLPVVIDQALLTAKVSQHEIQAIAVTNGPGLKGCLLVGVCFAKAFALGANIPLVAVNHIEGHVFAGDLLQASERPQFPFLALVVSGGHTQLVFVESLGKYNIVAETRDDAAGEAFDKCALLLGLGYPGGPALSKRAALGERNFLEFPRAIPKDNSGFSFSGLKTAVRRVVDENKDLLHQENFQNNLCASVQEAIVQSLVEKTTNAVQTLKPKALVLTGGVAANERLREVLGERMKEQGVAFVVPPRKWCTDNAAMIAVLAARKMESRIDEYKNWALCSEHHLRLGPEADASLGAFARLPI